MKNIRSTKNYMMFITLTYLSYSSLMDGRLPGFIIPVYTTNYTGGRTAFGKSKSNVGGDDSN